MSSGPILAAAQAPAPPRVTNKGEVRDPIRTKMPEYTSTHRHLGPAYPSGSPVLATSGASAPLPAHAVQRGPGGGQCGAGRFPWRRILIRQTEVRILPGPSRKPATAGFPLSSIAHFPIWVSPGNFCCIRWDQDLWRRLRGRISRQSAAIALLAALALAAIGIAGYQAGSPPSVDLGEVRAAARAAGSEAGATPGERKGYADGFEEARKRSYAPEYAAAYREAYAREFQLADLEPPEAIPVRRPQ